MSGCALEEMVMSGRSRFPGACDKMATETSRIAQNFVRWR